MASESKEVFKQQCKVLFEKIVIRDLSAIGKENECDFSIPVFCFPDPDDKYRNDFTAPLVPLNNSQINGKIFIEKENADCTWSEISELNDNTYGTPFSDGSRPDWVGYNLEWLKVYNLHDVGCYRLRLEWDDFISGETQVEYSFRYKLRLFNENLADETVRFTYTIQGGIRGSQWEDTQLIDYGSIVWTRQIRFKGIFGHSDSQEYTTETVRYENGANEWIEDFSVEKYDAVFKSAPHSLHTEIKKTILHADIIIVDDYNINNINEYVNKRVLRDSNYEPQYDKWTSYSPVEVRFSQYYQNTRSKRC